MQEATPRRESWIYVGLATWLVVMVAAFVLLWRYKMTPGALPDAPARWPAASAIHPAPDVANLVVFAHPQCPCTTATMTELARLADELHGRAKIHIVIARPDGAEPGFEHGRIEDAARRIANTDIVIDDGERETARFGAVVSGTALLYGRDGVLRFRGGLTIARGHEGRGPAHDRILALVDDRPADRADAPTYGCDLADPPLTARVP